MMKNTLFIFLCTSAILFSLSNCGKKKKTPDTPNTIPNCNLAVQTLVMNDTVYTITKDTSYATQNNTFYTEHKIADGHGCSLEFAGNGLPASGTYIITPIFTDLQTATSKVYIQYYWAGKTYLAQSGTLKLTQSITQTIVEYCKIVSKESFGDEKTISMKSDLE